MTCEVAVMNNRGIALAADSAVTLGERKIYYTAEKLFQLSTAAPVAILTYGSADIMGVPWETVVKVFSREVEGRKLDTVQQYADEFFRFMEVCKSLFPDAAQVSWFQRVVGEYWSSCYASQLKELSGKNGKSAPKPLAGVLSELVNRDIAENWSKFEPLEALGARYGDQVLDQYAEQLNAVEKDVFGTELPSKTRKDLRNVVRHMFSKKWVNPVFKSGIVLAGMGESEPFPALVHYEVGTIAAGRLRHYKIDDARVTNNNDAFVIPLAQRHMVDMFYGGMFPELLWSLPGLMRRCLDEVLGSCGKKLPSKTAEKCEQVFRETLGDEICEKYTDPLMTAVGALPRYELAKLAEALVNLTAFRARMAADENETVGGPIDVAVISKGDGFVWVKRKDLVPREAVNAAAAG